MPLVYREIGLECGYRLDRAVEECVIVEITAIEQVAPIHKAQLLSYLRLADCRIGLLINLNVKFLKDGISRIVNKD